MAAIRGQQAEVSLVFEVDVLDDSTRNSEKADLLFMLSLESMTRNVLDDYFSAQNAISPKSIKPILLSNEVLTVVRREVRRRTKHMVDEKDLKNAIRRLVGD